MALAAVGTFITDNNKVSATSRTAAVSTTIEAGNLAVLCVACDNLTTTDGNTNDITSVTDVRGNTWVKAREYSNGNGAAGAGVTVAIFYCVPTTQITAGDNITVNFSGSVAAKPMKGFEFTKGAGTTISVDGTGDEAVDAGDPGSITLTGSDSGEHLWVRACGGETATTTFTATAGYTKVNASATSGSTSDTNIVVGWEFKIATGTGSGASNPTCTTADWASTMVGLIEVAPPANNTSAIPVAAIATAGAAVSAVTTDKHFSDLPVAAIAVAGAAISAATTENHFSAIPVAGVSVAGLAPAATTTEANYSELPAAPISATAFDISATTTTGAANSSELPAAAITLSQNAVQAATTENNYGAVPAQALTVESLAIAATTSENHGAAIPVAQVVLDSLALQATTTEHHVSALPAGAIGLTAYAITAESSFIAIPDDNNPFLAGRGEAPAVSRANDLAAALPGALSSGRQSSMKAGKYG